MYADNLTFSNDNIFTKENTTYADVLSSIVEYTRYHFALESKINLFEASQILKDEPNAAPQQNTNTSAQNSNNGNNNQPSNNASGLANTIKEYSTKLANILQKVIAKIKDYVAIIFNKLKEVMAKIQEQMEKMGVRKSLDNIKANPNEYKYDDEYFKSSVSETEYANPRSGDILNTYIDIVKKYVQSSGELNTRSPEQLSTPVKDEDKEKLKNLQNAKTKGSEFSKDSNTDYFSNNLNKSWNLVDGLYKSLAKDNYAEVCTKFTNYVKDINNNVANVGKSLSHNMASSSNDANHVKELQARAKELISIGNATASLSSSFKMQMVQMNLSRLKIINTFIKLWKYSKNEAAPDNKETKPEESKAEQPKENPSENVNSANAP